VCGNSTVLELGWVRATGVEIPDERGSAQLQEKLIESMGPVIYSNSQRGVSPPVRDSPASHLCRISSGTGIKVPIEIEETSIQEWLDCAKIRDKTQKDR
jgi:hypothetical protein